MWSHTVETETEHLRAGYWDCPFCDASKKLIQTAELINQTLKSSFISHVRANGDVQHGGPQRLPDGYTASGLSEHFSSTEQITDES